MDSRLPVDRPGGRASWSPSSTTRSARRSQALPHDYKMVVLLADLEGFAYKEIAEILAVPVGTVMSRLYRGRRMLERSLLSFGRRYNYLSAPPSKLRDTRIDVSEFFAEATAS